MATFTVDPETGEIRDKDGNVIGHDPAVAAAQPASLESTPATPTAPTAPRHEPGLASGFSGAPAGFDPKDRALMTPTERGVQSAVQEGIINAPMGPAASVMGAAGGFFAPGNEAASAGGTAGGGIAERLLNRFRPGAGTAARVGARALGEGFGFAGGSQLSRLAEDQLLGKRFDTDNGSFWVNFATVGGASLTFQGAMAAGLRSLGRLPDEPVLRAANSLRSRREAQGIDFGETFASQTGRFGGFAQEFFETPEIAALRSRGGQRMVERLFPVELKPDQMNLYRENLKRSAASLWNEIKESAREQVKKGGGDPATPEGKKAVFDITNPLFRAVVGEAAGRNPLKQLENSRLFQILRSKGIDDRADLFISRLFGTTDADALNTLRAVKAMSATHGQPEMFDDLANTWIRRNLLGKSIAAVPGISGGARTPLGTFGGIISGASFAKRLETIGPDKIDEVFGPGRSEALKTLAEFMFQADPARAINTRHRFGGTLTYVGNKAVFQISGGGAEGATRAVSQIGRGAGFVLTTIGLAKFVRAALNNQNFNSLLLNALDDADGSSMQALIRAVVSDGSTPQDEGSDFRGAPPALRIGGF